MLVDREGLGDVMLKAPFLRALRRAFPKHEVWWIATHQSSMEDECRPMFEKDVARVITHAALDGPTGPLLKRLRALPPFERVFDSRTKISTVALARFGLRHRGFYACLPGYILCDGHPPAGRNRPRHIAERMLSLVPCATGRPADASGRLEASAVSRAEALRRLPGGPTYVGVAPGSRQANKNWPLENYAEAARALVARGVIPVFLLGPQEGDVETQVRAAAPGAMVLRADPAAAAGDGLDLLIAEGQRFSVLLANDNGVGHLLGAAGVPVVSLFGPTDPARWAPVAPANAILKASDFGGGEAIEAIPVGPVVDAVMAMARR
ncbi:MAG TPA: glycosyltransferase family 9 protein [Caulobacteraceae bacterium]|nr:glycosyltransferase family 9 protein [Caulobacteraceae bacterium]